MPWERKFEFPLQAFVTHAAIALVQPRLIHTGTLVSWSQPSLVSYGHRWLPRRLHHVPQATARPTRDPLASVEERLGGGILHAGDDIRYHFCFLKIC